MTSSSSRGRSCNTPHHRQRGSELKLVGTCSKLTLVAASTSLWTLMQAPLQIWNRVQMSNTESESTSTQPVKVKGTGKIDMLSAHLAALFTRLRSSRLLPAAAICKHIHMHSRRPPSTMCNAVRLRQHGCSKRMQQTAAHKTAMQACLKTYSMPLNCQSRHASKAHLLATFRLTLAAQHHMDMHLSLKARNTVHTNTIHTATQAAPCSFWGQGSANRDGMFAAEPWLTGTSHTHQIDPPLQGWG